MLDSARLLEELLLEELLLVGMLPAGAVEAGAAACTPNGATLARCVGGIGSPGSCSNTTKPPSCLLRDRAGLVKDWRTARGLGRPRARNLSGMSQEPGAFCDMWRPGNRRNIPENALSSLSDCLWRMEMER
jgi:hypothetical protein